MKSNLNIWATVNRVLWSIIALADVIVGVILANKLDLKIYILYGIVTAAIVVVFGFTAAAFLESTANSENHLANIAKNMPKPQQEPKPTYATVSATPRKSSPGFIVCPHCGESQNADRTVCFNCGTLFKKD